MLHHIHQCFFDVPQIVQHSFIIEWFDSVNIRIFIADNLCSQSWEGNYYERLNKTKFGFEIQHENYASFIYNTRTEATTEAIKKANVIYNNK